MRLLKLFAFLVLAKLISGCGLADISSGEFKDQKSNWIVPIFTSQISVESVSQLADLKFTREVPFPDLPAELKKIGKIDAYKMPSDKKLGPYKLEDNDNFYIKAKSDVAVLRAIIYNNFPFDMGPGTIVQIYNKRALPGDVGYVEGDTAASLNGVKKLIYQDTIRRTIKSGGGVDSLEIEEKKLLGWIDNDFEFFFLNFTTPGVANSPGISNPVKVVFKLIVLKINVVELNQDKLYELSDSSAIDLDGSDDYSVDRADFTLYLKNGFPASYDISCVFKNDSGNVVASLLQPNSEVNPSNIPSPTITFKDSTIEGKKVGLGKVGPATKEYQFVTKWTEAEYKLIKKRTTKVVTKGFFKTPKTSDPLFSKAAINLIHENKIGVTLTGKFQVNYDLEK